MGSSCLSVSNTSNFNGLTPWASVSSSVKVKWKLLSHVRLFVTPWTIHGLLQARILEWVAFPFSRKSSQPRNWTQVSHIAGGLFTSWATREAQEYWLGSLSLLQTTFLTQELNWGLLHCRWILYQMSYQGSSGLDGLQLHFRWGSAGEGPPSHVCCSLSTLP